MIDFVAVSGPEARTGVFAAMREAALGEGWDISDIGSDLWIASRGARIQIEPILDGRLMLIGEVIGTPAEPPRHREAPEAVCRRLTSSVWGRYVALLTEGDSALSGVFRDPSGAIDCAVRTVGSTRIISSAAPAWLTGGIEDRARISWTAIAGVLRDPITLSTADVLADWSTIAPGGLFTRDGAMSSIWSPGMATRALEPRDAAGLRRAVDLAVAGQTRGRSALLVEISGGLDSAIMASSLRADGFDGNALWLNTHGPFAESDERAYATAVADRLGVRLTVVERTRQDLIDGLAFDHPRTLRPGLNRMDAAYERRSKAELGGYYGRVLATNRDRLRPHLLEGRLAGQGLIDREQVEAALQIERLIWQGGYVELLLLALMESWVRAWTD